MTRKVFSLTHSHHERREAEKKGLRKWDLISLLFQGNQSALERSSYGERYKSSYGERYTSLSIVVYWLFVRTIGFKILLFPIIDSLGNPLRIFTCGIRACVMKFMILKNDLISLNYTWTLIMKFRDNLISFNYVWTLIMKFRDNSISLNYA